jgi:hypothetical protein
MAVAAMFVRKPLSFSAVMYSKRTADKATHRTTQCRVIQCCFTRYLSHCSVLCKGALYIILACTRCRFFSKAEITSDYIPSKFQDLGDVCEAVTYQMIIGGPLYSECHAAIRFSQRRQTHRGCVREHSDPGVLIVDWL